jgi:hypothetical protein
MAAPVVSLGITNYTLAESAIETNWVSIGGGAAAFESDYYIQGTESYTKRVSNGTRLVYNNTANANFGTGDHAYVWLYATGRAVVDSVANGGFGIFMSDGGSTNYKVYYTGGSDVSLATGWRCFVADPTQTANITNGASVTAANVAGLGGQLSTVLAAAGRNFAVDAIYVGTGLTITRGESTNAGGFSTITSINDNVNNQYGVFSASDTGAVLQGQLKIGVDDASTDTYFQESNSTVLVPDKNPLAPTNVNTSSTFTGISIVGGATTCILNNVSFFTADSHDKGYLYSNDGTNDPLFVDLDGCTFQEWGEVRMSSNTQITNTTWIGCEAITLNSGTIDQCTVETGVGGTYVFAAGTPDNISNTSFICPVAGGGHAFEVTQSGTYSFVGNQFTDVNGDPWGFVNTDNAAVHINGGGTGIAVTFNITGGGDGEFTYKLTGAGSTVTFVSAVSVNITGLPVVPTGNATEIRILGAGTTNEIAGVSTENHRTSTYSFSLSAGTNFDARLLNLDYVPAFVSGITANTDPTNIPVDLKIDRVYDDDTPPTGE